ncbi:MAG: M3 family metallopeptidase [Elusimicrobiota bacterium]
MKQLLTAVLSLSLTGTSFAAIPIKVAPAVPVGGMGSAAAGVAVRGPGAALELNFDLTPGQIKATFRSASQNLDAALNAIGAVKPAEATFYNTVHALEKAWVDYQDEMAGIRVLSASPRKRVREAVDQVNDMASDMGTAQGMREDIYQAVLAYAEKGEQLTGEDMKLVEDTLLDFRKSGMGLKPADRAKLQRVSSKISKLVRQYEINIREWEGGIDVLPEELAGVPTAIIGSLKKVPGGKLRVPDDGEAGGQVMSKAKSSKVRMRLYYAMQRKAAKKNLPILRKVLKLRKQQANMLGYKNFAEMKIDGRMAKTPQRVWQFLGRLRKMLRPAAEAEDAEILEQKRSEKPGAEKVQPWDGARYGRQHMEKTLDLNPDKIREYFPAERAIPEALKIYEELLGIRFEEIKDVKVWHKDVKAYDVMDAGGARMGRLYLDLYARKGKRGGAWAAPLVGGRALEDGTYREPVTAVTADFEKGENGKPTLLRHGNVKTLFHELGHAMHMTLTTAQRRSFSGSGVAWDFVEAPSQMMENFIWQKQVLARVSGHYKDPSQPLPPEIVEKLLASRNYHSASGALGQAAMAAMDLAYYTAAPKDVLGVFRKMMKTFTGVEPNKASKFPARFGHILTGYAAGYYGYLWSRVSAQDIFSIFEAAGVMSPEVGRRYRNTILARGSSIDEEENLSDFLGRKPSEEAFLKWLGVAPVGD